MNSATGQMVSRAIDIDTDIDWNIAPNLDEIPARVYSLVRILRAEKSRYQDELNRRPQK